MDTKIGRNMFKDRNGENLTNDEALRKISSRLLSYLEDLELWIVDSVGWIPFFSVRKFFYVGAGMKLGKKSRIHGGARFFAPFKIKIGEGSVIGEQSFLDGRGHLTIGDHVDIASEVLIYTSEHNINAEDFSAIHAPVTIGDYVFIGPRAIILPGVNIGTGAVIGAGAVVTKSVGEYKIAGGVPAREIGERQIKDLHYRLGRGRLFQ